MQNLKFVEEVVRRPSEILTEFKDARWCQGEREKRSHESSIKHNAYAERDTTMANWGRDIREVAGICHVWKTVDDFMLVAAW